MAVCLAGARGTNDFVWRSGQHLMIGDQRHYFMGGSCYYLAYWASDTSTNAATGRTYREDADAYMVRCRDLGCSAIRIWAFNDGADPRALQPVPGVHNEMALQGYDYVLKRADDLGLRIVMTLVNNWDDYGGMRWYVTNSPTASVHSDFYTDAQCRAWYRNHVNVLATRTNTFNGRVYREDPSIFAWQLANEPRWNSDPKDDNPVDETGETIRDWIWDMAAFVKSIDTNHMVSTGEEGWTSAHPWEGTRWELNNASPDIDYTVIHCWPDWWGWLWGDEPGLYANAMQWVRDHIAIAESLGKPFVLSEYGKVRPLDGEFGRHDYYRGWFDVLHGSAVADGAAAGMHFWMLEADGSDHDDGFSVFPHESATLSLVSSQARQMASLIAPLVTSVSAPGAGRARMTWTEVVGSPRYEIQASSTLLGTWTAIDTVSTNTWTGPATGVSRYYRIRPYWQ